MGHENIENRDKHKHTLSHAFANAHKKSKFENAVMNSHSPHMRVEHVHTRNSSTIACKQTKKSKIEHAQLFAAHNAETETTAIFSANHKWVCHAQTPPR